MVLFLGIEGIVLMNLLIAVLGDAFDSVKANEDAIRFYNYSLFMDHNRFTSDTVVRLVNVVKRYCFSQRSIHCVLH